MTLTIWQQRMAHRWQRFAPQLRYHAVPLYLVLVATLIGQLTTLVGHPFILTTPDSPTYINFAQRIMHGHWFDNQRTPVYPALLAVAAALFGTHQLGAVISIQIGLTVAAIYEIYVLVWRLCERRWMAALVASAVGLNLFMLQWERFILTECLTFWEAVTLFVLFERYLRTQRWGYFVGITVLCILSIFTRPSNVFLPLILFTVLGMWQLVHRVSWQRWAACVLALTFMYSLVGLYAHGNGTQTGYYGLSIIGDVNLFGKVLEYHMQNEWSDPRNAPLGSAVSAYAQQGGIDPYVYLRTHGYSYQLYLQLGPYDHDVISHHLGEYAVKSLPDIGRTLTAPAYFDTGAKLPKAQFLAKVGQLPLALNLFLPLLAMLLGIGMVWRFRLDRHFILLGLLLVALSNVVLTGVGSYAELYRLRAPFDWAMLLATVVILVELGMALRGQRSVLFRFGKILSQKKSDALLPVPDQATQLLPIVASKISTSTIDASSMPTMRPPSVDEK